MKTLVLVLVIILTYATAEKNEIDSVLGLLDTLRNSVTKEVETLDETWSKTGLVFIFIHIIYKKKQSLLSSLSNTI